MVTCVKCREEEGKEESNAKKQLLDNYVLLRHWLLWLRVRLHHCCRLLADGIIDIQLCALDLVLLRLKSGHGRRGESCVLLLMGDRANNP